MVLKDTKIDSKPLAEGFFFFFVVGIILSFLLAGGPRQAACGVFLVFSGLGMILFIPRYTVSSGYIIFCLVFVGALFLSLLPEAMTSNPSWRTQLVAMTDFHDSTLISVSPRETIYWIVISCLSVAIGLCALSHPLTKRGLEFYALLSVLGVTVYTLFAMAVWMNGWHYRFFEPDPFVQPCFGFFPSRNQTSSLLLSTTIVSAALILQLMISGKFLRGIFVGVILAVLASGVLFFSKSRGGVVFLALGLVIWIAGLGRERVRFMIPVVLPVILALIIFFISSPGGARDRFFGLEHQGPAHASKTLTNMEGFDSNSRVRIFRDTFKMIEAYPLTGSGLGTFASIYPFYADKSLSEATALHAESDWLTLMEEGGILALLGAFGLLILLCFQMKQFTESDSWPLRWGIFSAFLTEVCHGFVDVPAHRPELGWWMLLLATLPAASMQQKSSFPRLQRIFYSLAGIVAVSMGVLLIDAQWLGGKTLPPYFVKEAIRKITSLYEEGNYGEASALASRARTDYPMAWELSYLEGAISLAGGLPPETASRYFDIENALRPMNEVPPEKAGAALSEADPLRAALYWRESLRRRLVMDSSSNCPIARSNELFRSMLGNKVMRAKLLNQSSEIAAWSPSLRMVWLSDPDCPSEELSKALHDPFFMNRLSAKEKGGLLQRWWERGDQKAVSDFMDSHPEYAVPGASTKAAMLLASGQADRACRLLVETFGIPVPSNPSEARFIQAADTDVPTEPLLAARYYMEHGNGVAARHLLDEASKDMKSANDQTQILLLRAQLEMSSGNWSQAFPLIIGYLHASGLL